MNVWLRPATPLDAGQAGAILHRFQQDTSWMPKEHSGAEAISFCDQMIAKGWVSVAEVETHRRIVGFMAQDGAEICALYLTAEARGQGIGKAFLARAKAASPSLKLWTFQANTGAQRFYLREGFVEVQRTDGAANGEGLPDVEYHWPPKQGESDHEP
ncbi:GNAT family N-acetyltransferase [Tritonibacter horizontis]|nr:GNAT family N-acetyltransferase [Tritonibacter horizontis]